MPALKRAVGTIAATTLVTSGLAGAAAAEPPAPKPAAEQQLVQDLLVLLISGIGRVGETLSISKPLTDGLPLLDGWDIEWLRDGVPIPGADKWEYVPGLEDAGHELQARVTGLLVGIPVVSGLTNALPIPVPGEEPGPDPADELTALFDAVIIQLADRLMVTPPGADGWSLPGVTESVQWFRDLGNGGVPIPGAEEWDYTPTLEDAGAQLYAVVTGAVAGLPLVQEVSNRIQLPGSEIQATAPAQIKRDATHGVKVGAVLTAQDPEWNVEVDSNTYQWMRAGKPIAGATTSSHTIVPADVGQQLTVVVTGSRTNPITQQQTTGASTSAPVTAEKGAAPEVVTAPSVSGTAAVGERLTTQPGTWRYAVDATAPDQFSYRWLRGDSPVPGATGSSYTLTAADAGKALSLEVTAVRAGFEDGVWTSSPIQVAATDAPPAVGEKAESKVRLRLPDKRIRRGTRAKVRIVVRAGGETVTGKVKIRHRGTVIRKVRIKARHDGVRVVRLPRLAPGKYRLKAVYLGSADVERGTSRKVTLRVVPKRR